VNVLQWININFKVINRTGSEVQFPCPKCKHESFYFNVNKKVGFCHRAKCLWKPNLQTLLEFVGSGRQWLSEDFSEEPDALRPAMDVTLPEGAQQIVYYEDGELMTKLPTAFKALTARGISAEDQARFMLRFDGTRVYIPVYRAGKLVNYVGRAAWWFDNNLKRYKYPKGHSIVKHLFNWDEVRLWPRLTLVENTFNAIWLREALNCSTNFGSHLSNEQATMICDSKIESVAFLWDEGADIRAEKAVQLLSTKFGIPSAYCKISGQPDDHTLDFLTEAAYLTHEAARIGRKWISKKN
jgi:hypothetical protein